MEKPSYNAISVERSRRTDRGIGSSDAKRRVLGEGP